MIDLDTKIRSLVERNIPRKDIVSELDAIASDAESRAKRFERAKKKGDRYRARGLPTWGRRFSPASSRRRRHSAPFTRPKLRSGGRSSRPRTSRENKSGSRLAFQGSNMMKFPAAHSCI